MKNSNIKYDDLPTGLRWAIDLYLEQQTKIADLEKQLVVSRQKFGTYQPYEKVDLPSLDPKQDESTYRERIKTAIEAARRNAERAIANNLLVNELAMALKATGIPDSHQEWKRNKRVTVTHDWLANLRTCLSAPNLNEQDILRRIEDYRRSRADYVAAEEKKAREAQIERELQEERRKHQSDMVALALKLGLTPETAVRATNGELTEILYTRNKYLRLAVAGIETRNDWSDGAWRVLDALRTFVVENNDDRAIAEEWAENAHDCEDGRIFRDSTWNYNRLIKEKIGDELWSMWNVIARNEVA